MWWGCSWNFHADSLGFYGFNWLLDSKVGEHNLATPMGDITIVYIIADVYIYILIKLKYTTVIYINLGWQTHSWLGSLSQLRWLPRATSSNHETSEHYTHFYFKPKKKSEKKVVTHCPRVWGWPHLNQYGGFPWASQSYGPFTYDKLVVSICQYSTIHMACKQ